MAVSKTFNGTVYQIPQARDTAWGDEATNFLIDVADSAVTLNGVQTLANKTFTDASFTGGTIGADVVVEKSPVITLAGDITGTVTLSNLGDGTLTATIAPNSVALGTDTTGDYVATVTGTANEITVTGTGEGAAVTVSLPSSITLTGKTVTGGSFTPTAVSIGGSPVVTEARNLTAGTGLTGGGSLAADRAFALTGQALALHNLATDGLVTRTGSGTVAARSIAVSGTGLSITNGDGVLGNPTVSSNATSANTPSTIVARDASGNFTAGTVTAALSGNASTATKLATARTISVTGDATGSVSFDGSADASITAVLATVATAGTYRSVTVDAKGRVTAGSNPTTLSGYGITDAAPLASPAFTGVPTAPTATAGANSAQIATTEFVTTAITNAEFGTSDPSFTTVTLSAGTVTAPSLTTTGDPNTGVFWPSADTVALTTGGTERLRVANDGTISLGGLAGSEGQTVYGATGRTRLRGGTPVLELYDTGMGTDQKSWRFISSSGSVYLQTLDDNYSAVLATALGVSRAGVISLGGLAGSESLRVSPVPSSNRYVTAAGSNGARPSLSTNAGDLLVTSNTGNVQFARNKYVGSSISSDIAIGSSGGSQIGFLQNVNSDYLEFYVHKSGVHHKMALRLDENGNAVFGDSPTLTTNSGNLTLTSAGGTVNVTGVLTVNGSAISATLPTTEVTGTSATMAANNAYVANNAAQVKLTLPSTAAVGTVIEVIGKGAGGWAVDQGANQYIRYPSNASTLVGSGNGLYSADPTCCLRLICTEANKGWTLAAYAGNFSAYEAVTDWGSYNGTLDGVVTTLASRGDGVHSVKINEQYQFLVYHNGTNLVGRVATVSGTTISVAAEQSFGSTNLNINHDDYALLDASDLTNVRIFQAFGTDPTSGFYARVLTVNCSTGAMTVNAAINFHNATYESRSVNVAVLTSSKVVVQTGGAFTNPRVHAMTVSGTTVTTVNSIENGNVGVLCRLDNFSVLAPATPYGGTNHQTMQVYDFTGASMSASASQVNTGASLHRALYLSDGKAAVNRSDGGTTNSIMFVANVNASDVITKETDYAVSGFNWGSYYRLTANAVMLLRPVGNNLVGRVASISASDVVTDRSDVTLYAGGGSTYPAYCLSAIDQNHAFFCFQDQTNGPLKVRVLKRA